MPLRAAEMAAAGAGGKDEEAKQNGRDEPPEPPTASGSVIFIDIPPGAVFATLQFGNDPGKGEYKLAEEAGYSKFVWGFYVHEGPTGGYRYEVGLQGVKAHQKQGNLTTTMGFVVMMSIGVVNPASDSKHLSGATINMRIRLAVSGTRSAAEASWHASDRAT